MTVAEQFSLRGRAALVTGGGRGLGRAGAIALAEAGAEVYVAGRNARALEETAGVINAAGHHAKTVDLDVSDVTSIEEAVRSVASKTERLAILVNNAGIVYESRLVDAAPVEIEKVIATNLTGVLLMSRAFAAVVDESLSPSVINVSSLAAHVGVKGQVAYSASKGGVNAATRSLALELADQNVRVNAVSPGYFDTDMPSEVTSSPPALAALLRKIPMRRLGLPDEIGATLVFLASPASAYMTGAVIPLDGGFIAQ